MQLIRFETAGELDDTEVQNYAAHSREGIWLGSLSPVIVEQLPSGRIDLVDGYHRLASAIAEGHEEVNAVLVTSDEMASCSEFGDGDLSEDEWVAGIERQCEERGWRLV